MWCLPSCLTTLESSVLTEEFYVDLSSSGCIRDQYLSIAQRRLRHKLSKRAGRCLLYVPCQKFLGCLRSDVLGVMGGYLARDVRMLKGTGMRSTLLRNSTNPFLNGTCLTPAFEIRLLGLRVVATQRAIRHAQSYANGDGPSKEGFVSP